MKGRLSTILVISLCLVASSAGARMNVLFIAVDDLANVSAPSMDKLAASGVRFERAYNQIPLCNPSRASVLTGLRPDHTGVYDLERNFRETLPDVLTLPQLFKNNGWRTVRVGKIFHYDVPAQIGTDGMDDPLSWGATFNPKGRDVADEALITNPLPEKPISAALSWLSAGGEDEEQTDGMVATEAIRQMSEDKERPFFLGVGFFRPHTPFVAPKKYFDLHPPESIKLPEAPTDDRDDIPTAAFAHNNPVPHYGLDELTCRKALQAYLAAVSFVDAQIGRLLKALDDLKLRDNTVVVLWSDHGYHLGEHQGVWQKRTLFEQGARAPLIIRSPGARGNGRSCRQVVEFVDIYPTVTELCALGAPSSLDGRSLMRLLDDPEAKWDGAAVTQIVRPADNRLKSPVMGRSVRTERWRFTEWNGGAEGTELYDHDADPEEFHNLAGDPGYADVREDLKRLMEGKARALAPLVPFNPKRL